MDFQVGQRFGDYEVVKLLGVGGMGHVYLVRNIISNRTEAMKVLLPDFTAEPELAARFISEIRTLASFDHPNIAQLRTAFQANNRLIMIMEFVEGSTLEQMAHGQQLSIQSVADYISQSLSALSYAHAHGVVHRDIKPANLMVTSHGIVKLMDFGIAKSTTEDLQHTRPGTTIGSLHYMSPEQVRGGTIDARSDLYSVGVVLYELTAGRRPFEADTTFSILNQQLNIEPTPPIQYNPQLPPELNQVIMTALAKDPLQRFQSAEDFRAALKAFRTVSAPVAATVLMPVPPTAAAVSAPPPAPMPMASPAIAGATAATLIMDSSAAAPAFAPVPNTAPPAAYNNAAYAPPAPAQMSYGTPVPPPAARSRSHRGLWIATGALAVILAMVCVGFALPHIVRTFASSRNTPATANPSAQQTAAPSDSTPSQQAVASTDPGSSPLSASNSPASTSTAPASASPAPQPAYGTPASSPHSRNPQSTGTNVAPLTNTPVASQPAPQPSNGAGLEEAQERFTQLQGRSSAAQRAVARIRSQQEAEGLGMRGDIETADSRLNSYLSTANNALARGDSAAAQRAMDKAEPDMATLEKFLGH